MAAIKHARGVKLLLKVGDGAEPEVFTAICSINTSRELAFDAATNEFNIGDCEDPELIGWLVREKVSLSSSFSGAGTLNTPDIQRMWDWYKSPEAKNCQLVMDVPSADGGVIWSGAYHLTNFGLNGDIGTKAQASVSLVSDGEVEMEANT